MILLFYLCMESRWPPRTITRKNYNSEYQVLILERESTCQGRWAKRENTWQRVRADKKDRVPTNSFLCLLRKTHLRPFKGSPQYCSIKPKHPIRHHNVLIALIKRAFETVWVIGLMSRHFQFLKFHICLI